MRAWLRVAAVLAAAACAAACGGNVVVDGSGSTTGSTTGTGTSSGTLPSCKNTCLEAIKNGGGVCPGTPGSSAFTSFAGCSDLNCASVCADLGANGASPSCLDCMAQLCMNEVAACTAN